MAYECIDRHVDNGKGEKIALNYKDEKRKESYTYSDLKSYQIKQLMFLKIRRMLKRRSCFIFMSRTPELYFAFLGILKLVRLWVHYLKRSWRRL